MQKQLAATDSLDFVGISPCVSQILHPLPPDEFVGRWWQERQIAVSDPPVPFS